MKFSRLLGLILCFNWFSGTCLSQEIGDFLKVESTEAYRLLNDDRLDLRSAAVRQSMSQLQQMLYTDYFLLESMSNPISSKPPVGNQLSARAVKFAGRLLSIRQIPQLAAGSLQVTTPEEALAAAQTISETSVPTFICEVEHSELDSPVIFVTPSVPNWIQLRLAASNDAKIRLDETTFSVQCEGLRLTAGRLMFDNIEIASAHTVIGKRLAWLPVDQTEVQAAGELDESETWVQLGRAGFDVGLLEALRKSQRAPLVETDNEPFYQLLAESRKIVPAAGWPALSVRETIVDPKKLVGQGFRLSAVVKQITRVPLDENDRGTQLGLKQYYLLHALVQLDKPIRLKVSDTENLTYGQQYPVVIAATTLPNRWTASENMRRWVDAKCLFAKSWTYQSAKTIDSSASQWSPLLIGVQLNETTAPQSSDTSWPVGWLLLIPVGLATLGLLVAGISGFRR